MLGLLAFEKLAKVANGLQTLKKDWKHSWFDIGSNNNPHPIGIDKKNDLRSDKYTISCESPKSLILCQAGFKTTTCFKRRCGFSSAELFAFLFELGCLKF
jgi:hypothetical protein